MHDHLFNLPAEQKVNVGVTKSVFLTNLNKVSVTFGVFSVFIFIAIILRFLAGCPREKTTMQEPDR